MLFMYWRMLRSPVFAVFNWKYCLLTSEASQLLLLLKAALAFQQELVACFCQRAKHINKWTINKWTNLEKPEHSWSLLSTKWYCQTGIQWQPKAGNCWRPWHGRAISSWTINKQDIVFWAFNLWKTVPPRPVQSKECLLVLCFWLVFPSPSP